MTLKEYNEACKIAEKNYDAAKAKCSIICYEIKKLTLVLIEAEKQNNIMFNRFCNTIKTEHEYFDTIN